MDILFSLSVSSAFKSTSAQLPIPDYSSRLSRVYGWTTTLLGSSLVSRYWLDPWAPCGKSLPPILSLIDVINNTIRLLPYAADKHIYFNDSAKGYLLGLISTMMERVWAWWISRSRLFLRNIFSQSIFYDSRLRFGHSTALILLIIPIMRVCSGLSPAQQIAYEILM